VVITCNELFILLLIPAIEINLYLVYEGNEKISQVKSHGLEISSMHFPVISLTWEKYYNRRKPNNFGDSINGLPELNYYQLNNKRDLISKFPAVQMNVLAWQLKPLGKLSWPHDLICQ
jgi:hypothetical protein